jgi:hypothetical protein
MRVPSGLERANLSGVGAKREYVPVPVLWVCQIIFFSIINNY